MGIIHNESKKDLLNNRSKHLTVRALLEHKHKMIYGKYKNARNAAWQCLIDYNVTSLPVSVLQVAKLAGIKVVKSSRTADLLLKNEIGASIIINKQWYIVYNDSCSRQRCRFTVAHELGHIFLGHELKKRGNLTKTFKDSGSFAEQEANIFASRLLAPACIIWALGLKTANEISAVCDISHSAAEFRAERMNTLYKRNRFLTSSLERKVYNNFNVFIQNSKENKFYTDNKYI